MARPSRFLILALLAFGLQNAHADTSGQGVIVVGGTLDYPPFHYLNKKNQPEGFDIDLISAVAREAGMQVKFRLGDWQKILHDLEFGNNVDVVPMFVSAERQLHYDFSTPFLSRYHVLFGRKEMPPLRGINALSGKSVLVQRAGFAAEELRIENSSAIRILTDEEPDALRILSSGKYDYALVPELIGRYAIKTYHIENITTKSPPILTRDYAFAVRKGNTPLLERINDGIQKVLANGQYDQIYGMRLSNLHTQDEIREPILQKFIIVATVLIVLTFALLLSSRKLRTRIRQQGQSLKREHRLRSDAESKAQFLAFYDVLTELPNRIRFVDDLDRAIAAASATQSPVAVFCFNVTNLHQINQLAGHVVGDKLLRVVGQFLQDAHSNNAGVISPGCFVVRYENINSQVDAYLRARSLLEKIREPKCIDGLEISIDCRGGLAIYPEDSSTADGLIRNAELALTIGHDSKRDITKYSEDYEPDPRNLKLLGDLPKALKNRELQLYCQPKLSLADDQVCGAEILLRWAHPELGLLTPNLFIPLAERTGAIREITLYVVRRISEYLQLGALHDTRSQFSINVSAVDVGDGEFSEKANAIIGDFGPRLIVEITETGAMDDPQEVIRTIEKLQKRGISISIDDFGTGYSSLSYLKQLKPEELKIDRMFIKDLRHQGGDQILVKSTISMAHDLGIKVVAEGVEDRHTADMLSEMNCDVLQGYLISKPIPLSSYREWLALSPQLTF